MSLEPTKPIEDLLKQPPRRGEAQFGADLKLSNPMRAQLHHEIARVARDDDAATIAALVSNSVAAPGVYYRFRSNSR
jgi:hypothetical protein